MSTDGPVKAKVSFKLSSYPRDGRIRLVAASLLSLAALGASHRAEAEWGEATGEPGHFGVVLNGAAEFGGDGVAKVYYTNGDTQNITAGQGVTLGGGIHYRPVSLPVDFAATVGYKFTTTAASNLHLSIDRVVIQFTGTVPLGNHFWADAGPVWHTGVKLNGDSVNYTSVPDVNFDDAIGGTVGFGWRWIGVSYTYIKYRAFGTSFDASNGGITFGWKF
jgi:hypothetical protein